MYEICHRCGGELPSAQLDGSDGKPRFCPHCGAPQLMLSDYAEPLSTGAEERGTGKGGSTGTLPPPRASQIDWKLAIRSASLVAVVAAVLSAAGERVPNLRVFSFIWIISASLTTLALYQRRRPLATMNLRIGAKIGLLVGVELVSALGAALSIGFVVARFGLHVLADFDRQIAQQMKDLTSQILAKGSVAPDQLAFIGTVQFRTGYVLCAFGLVLLSIFMLSILSGAVAGLLRTRRSTLA